MDYMFLTVFVIGTLAVISPGPDFIIVSRNTLLHSKRAGIATAFGIALGNLLWITASVLGISYVISQTVLLFNILKWIGALYLIYIGLCALKSKKQSGSSIDTGKESSHMQMTQIKAFKMGLLTNVLNAKCALFFMSLFSVIITPATPLLLRCAYGLEITLIATIWFSFLANVLSINKVRKIFERFSIWIDRATGAILIALGLKIALSKS